MNVELKGIGNSSKSAISMRHMTKKRLLGKIAGKTVMWCILLFFLFYTLFPMIWLVISSFKTNVELFDNPFSLPKVWQFQNYKNAFQVSGLAVLFRNSIVISLCATAFNLFVASMAGFVLARQRFKLREAIFVLLISGILIPVNALMVPYYKIITQIKLYDSIFALILTYGAMGLPISVFLVRGFMKTIPWELEESATIDGCNFYQRFFKIILPLSKTGLITAGTFQFLLSWNEFIYAMLLTSSTSSRTIQLGIRYFSNQFTTDYTSMYAAIVISIIPSLTGYILFQEQIISGLTSGAVKG